MMAWIFRRLSAASAWACDGVGFVAGGAEDGAAAAADDPSAPDPSAPDPSASFASKKCCCSSGALPVPSSADSNESAEFAEEALIFNDARHVVNQILIQAW